MIRYPLPNDWKKIGDDYWMSFRWDVCFVDGRWRVAQYLEKGYSFDRDFDTAEDAIEFVEQYEEKIGLRRHPA